MVETMAALYLGVMRVDPTRPNWPERDRFILSKGHGAMAYYAALKQVGFVTDEELLAFKSNDTFLYGHPSMNVERGIEFSSGSLGLGLALGVGTALGLRRRGNVTSRVFVLMGDGECNEGSVWESAISAAHFGLGNVIAIIDKNGLQYDGPTGSILTMGDLEAKWRSFGWAAHTVDGHDVAQLHAALSDTPSDVPTVVIANTVKGKGVSFMENEPGWHHSRLSSAQLDQALAEVAETT
jgi:transketolase